MCTSTFSTHGLQLTLVIILLLFAGGCTETNKKAGAGTFEKIPQGEAEQIQHIANLTPELQDKRAVLPEQQGKVLRGVHPKAHGCVQAEFVINEDISKKYQVGLFKHPGKKYAAQIRFSNASVRVAHDLENGKNGSRGMAIKVYDVKGQFLEEDNGRQNQDFLMINTPEFAFANVRSYTFLTDTLNASPHGNDPNKLFGLVLILAKVNKTPPPFPVPQAEDLEKLKAILASQNSQLPAGFTLKDLQELTITLNIVVTKIQTQPVRNPLQVQYFGAAPFLFGPDRVMKFTAAPQQKVEQKEFTTEPSENYLREALAETMAGNQDVVLDFKIQVRNTDADFGEGQELIENATTTWDTTNVKEVDNYVNVAKIIIKAPQQTMTTEAQSQCEQLAFSPWHSLAAHQPVGGINRLRKGVYINSELHRK